MEEKTQEQSIRDLEDTVEILNEEIARVRNSNRILRVANSSLRRQINIAHQNDEDFKSMCQGDIALDVLENEGGLPEPQAT